MEREFDEMDGILAITLNTFAEAPLQRGGQVGVFGVACSEGTLVAYLDPKAALRTSGNAETFLVFRFDDSDREPEQWPLLQGVAAARLHEGSEFLDTLLRTERFLVEFELRDGTRPYAAFNVTGLSAMMPETAEAGCG